MNGLEVSKQAKWVIIMLGRLVYASFSSYSNGTDTEDETDLARVISVLLKLRL